MIFRHCSSQYDKYFCQNNDLSLVGGLVASVIEELPAVQVDKVMLELVLTEALNNAVIHGIFCNHCNEAIRALSCVWNG